MPRLALSARSAMLASLSILVAGLSTSVLAAGRAKGATIRVPASAMANASSKLCMPRTTLGPRPDPSLPKTMCLTREEWAAQGVIIVVR